MYHSIKNSTGGGLFYQIWKPASGDYQNVVIAVHGAGGHSLGDCGYLGKFLTGNGICVYAPDLRGFGRSKERKGDIKNEQIWLDDMDLFVEEVLRKENGKQIFVVGYSTGALIFINYLLRKPRKDIRGVVSVSIPLQIAFHVPLWKDLGGKVFGFLSFPMMFNEFKAEYLFSGKGPREEYFQDKMRYDYVTPRWYAGFLRMIKYIEQNAGRLDIPVLVVYGDKDGVAKPESSPAFFSKLDKLKEHQKRLKAFPGFRHAMLNEKNEELGLHREEIFKDILRFIHENPGLR